MSKSLTERFYNHEELTAAERTKLGAGNIRINRIQCKKCLDIITSENRHDFKWCKCGSVAVDGGSWYLKRAGIPDGFNELSEIYKDQGVEEVVRPTKIKFENQVPVTSIEQTIKTLTSRWHSVVLVVGFTLFVVGLVIGLALGGGL